MREYSPQAVALSNFDMELDDEILEDVVVPLLRTAVRPTDLVDAVHLRQFTTGMFTGLVADVLGIETDSPELDFNYESLL